MAINVAIVEDELETLEGLKILVNASDNLFCIGTYESAEAIIKSFKHLQADIVLMDINLPGSCGIQCVRELKLLRPQVQFIMCTDLDDDDKIFEALRAGAAGYLVKNISRFKLEEAILEIYQGGSWMTPKVAKKVISFFYQNQKNTAQANTLTAREKELMKLVEKGYSNKEIAEHLTISINTVKIHISNIYEKLQVHNKTAAVNKLKDVL